VRRGTAHHSRVQGASRARRRSATAGSHGYGCTEAPRGILYHRYRLADDGSILDAKIVPPTSQNQKTIESDLWRFVAERVDLPEDTLTWQCEQAIRNYDPCISCATHFWAHIDRETDGRPSTGSGAGLG
jgi:coenzyme F420-reducing hydrogenase alpha subunit